jgi:hypothetical protein
MGGRRSTAGRGAACTSNWDLLAALDQLPCPACTWTGVAILQKASSRGFNTRNSRLTGGSGAQIDLLLHSSSLRVAPASSPPSITRCRAASSARSASAVAGVQAAGVSSSAVYSQRLGSATLASRSVAPHRSATCSGGAGRQKGRRVAGV